MNAGLNNIICAHLAPLDRYNGVTEQLEYVVTESGRPGTRSAFFSANNARNCQQCTPNACEYSDLKASSAGKTIDLSRTCESVDKFISILQKRLVAKRVDRLIIK